MDCSPAAIARGSPCWCLPDNRQRAALIYFACAWANAGGASPCTLPTAPIDLGASAATGNVVLTWPAGVGATGYKIKRALVPGGPYTVIGTSAASPYTDTTGVSGTAYYYVVSSTNACGESAGNSIESHATPVYASFLVTTTGAQTLTIAALTVTAALTVDWGDGNTNSYAGSGARTHNYAGAGAWTVKFLSPLLVTVLQLSDNKITLNSNLISTIVNVRDFEVSTLKAGTFNSSDVSAWRPTTFNLFSMPAGYAGTFNSSDVSAWRPTTFEIFAMPSGYAGTFNSADVSAWRPLDFRIFSMPTGYAGTFNSADVSAWRPDTFFLRSMPTGYAGTFNSADVSAWRPTSFRLDSLPTATFTITISAGGFAGWTGATLVNLQSDALSQSSVDQILADLYTAFATRTVTGGTITLNGTGNAAPSGIFQSQTPPTSGKETAYDLLNDPTNINPTKKWATITTN